MDLSTYNFPKVTEIDLAFSTFNTPKELVEEAQKRKPQRGVNYPPTLKRWDGL